MVQGRIEGGHWVMPLAPKAPFASKAPNAPRPPSKRCDGPEGRLRNVSQGRIQKPIGRAPSVKREPS